MTCQGRKTYSSHAAAQSVIYRMRAQGVKDQLEVKQCVVCKKWHLAIRR